MSPVNGSPMLKRLTQSGAIPHPVAGEKETGSASLELFVQIKFNILPFTELFLLAKSAKSSPKTPGQLFGLRSKYSTWNHLY